MTIGTSPRSAAEGPDDNRDGTGRAEVQGGWGLVVAGTGAVGLGVRGGVLTFEVIELDEAAVGVEDGWRQGFGDLASSLGVDVGAGGTLASEYGETALAGDDLATGSA